MTATEHFERACAGADHWLRLNRVAEAKVVAVAKSIGLPVWVLNGGGPAVQQAAHAMRNRLHEEIARELAAQTSLVLRDAFALGQVVAQRVCGSDQPGSVQCRN